MATQTYTSANSTPASLLRRALQIDGLGVTITGLALIFAADMMAGLTGIPKAIVLPIGIFLLGFALFIWYHATRPTIAGWAAWVVIGVNVLSCIESVAALLMGWLPVTMFGWWFIVIQALLGLVIAEVEYLGLRRQR